ncbi:MAG TPA: GNAT family N-acyltransferase [Aestuariivirga sp.]|nr:GNAT family N-acyltransferase [Aestuariivirga sp.]
MRLRLAQGAEEIRACQALRYRIFYEELSAKPDVAVRTDADRFDAFCDHLVVVRKGKASTSDPVLLADGELVGTYRLLRQEIAEQNGGFYTQEEFDIAPVLLSHPDLSFLELGRSCVLKPYRTKPVVELLWQGIWNYVRSHGIDVMFGCASLEGTSPEAHAQALTFLAEHRVPPPEWQVQALPDRYLPMKRRSRFDAKAALRALPPLIKGYLRLGCYIGEGAVIDSQFNTIDIFIILPVSAIDSRYFARFGEPNGQERRRPIG